jgi:hydroxylamine reductase
MFCYQCEQTAKGTGCTIRGVCGKEDSVARLQDILIWSLQGLSQVAHRARQLNIIDKEADILVFEGMFSTITNVNFDPDRVFSLICKTVEKRDLLKEKTGINPAGPAQFKAGKNQEELLAQSDQVSLWQHIEKMGEVRAGLLHLILYGLKGISAYADHAKVLGYYDEAIAGKFHELMNFIAQGDHTQEDLLEKVLETGKLNLSVMGLLDKANTETYGHPEPMKARMSPIKGKAILISGHDLKDLEALLEQSKGKGINIYTHGEMLPALAYPKFKHYDHFIGNYGSAWQNQLSEFAQFPGPILMTTNCIQRPSSKYMDRIFTSGLVAWPGVVHIADRNFSPLINTALSMEGFTEDAPEKVADIGFAHHAVLGLAEVLLAKINEGKIKHIFLIGGCDGAKPGRSYYTDFAKATPPDTLLLTLACGKYRINKESWGDIDGIPRLLDVGQCNDAYSAVLIAKALAEALSAEINDLPLTLVLSWYEQKAVAVLLSLLSLGIKNIRIGPSLPAFIKAPVWEILQNQWGMKAIDDPQKDLQEILK